ncbi:hypothetical protein EON65_13515 [archaeon]|nr:MAG: hypothetical protein EON65_13515 [archaeon]
MEACKYAVKGADYSLSRGAFHDCLLFAYMAYELAETRSEYKILLQVVELGLDTVKRCGIYSDTICIEHQNELWTYSRIQQSLLQLLEQSVKTIVKPRLSLHLPQTDTEMKSADDAYGSDDVQRLTVGDRHSFRSPHQSPLSPIRLSWKASFTMLTKLQGAQVELVSQRDEQHGDAGERGTNGRRDVDETKCCCTVC